MAFRMNWIHGRAKNPREEKNRREEANSWDVKEIDRFRMLLRLQILAAFGCLLIFLYAWHFKSTDLLRITGVGMLVAGASLLSGVLLGFIFAVPRVAVEKEKGKSAPNSKNADDTETREHVSPITTNSNLVEISDWLTKIIVGVGLVELRSIPGELGKLAYYLGPGLRPALCDPKNPCSADYLGSGEAAALAIIIFFCSLGFLIGYIWTLLYFQQDLERQFRALEQKVDHLRQSKVGADRILLAEVSLDNGSLTEAMSVIDEALQDDPNDGRAVLTKARILKRQATGTNPPDREKLGQALALVERATALLPGKGEVLYNKACYQALLGFSHDEVLANLEAAFHLDPALRTLAPKDPDLESVHHDDDFKRLIGKN